MRGLDPGTLRVGRDTLKEGFFLLVASGSSSTMHLIPDHQKLVIGRDATADIRVAGEAISRRHAMIYGGDPPEVEDLGSTNGTRVDGVVLPAGQRRPVGAGVVIEIGSVLLCVQRGRPAPEAATSDTDQVLAIDETMVELYRIIDTVAPTSLPVLILGETGVGKEVVAREVHRRSPRGAKPLLSLNCAALPETLLESELFGHEKGAFTGALQAKQGLFESANGGTVFLDELGELPLSTQAKLLRFLESGEVLRVGAVRPKRLDVRLLAATNRDLEEMIELGSFRADLFFRINGVSVVVPPLRERRVEIEPLTRLFIERTCVRENLRPPVLSEDALQVLVSHPWPGNVRELKNVIERAIVLCRSGLIEPQHLLLKPPRLRKQPDRDPDSWEVPTSNIHVVRSLSNGAAPVRDLPAGRDEVGASLAAEVFQHERQRIMTALDRCAGNQKRAAELLGLSRRQLQRRLDTYAIPRPRKTLSGGT